MSEARNNPVRISLLTACLNSEKTIERTLKSIEMQKYAGLEYIVIDGGSTDGTLAILQKYGHLTSKVISEKDKNIPNAYNKGFHHATGDVFCWLNADDEFTENALLFVADFFAKHPDVDVLTGGCKRIFADGSTRITQVPARFRETMALRNNIEQPSTFWRADIHRKAGVLDESYFLAFDWEWWNRLHSVSARFCTTNQVLSVYHFTNENLTSRAGQKVIDELYRITKQYGPLGVADAYRFIFRHFDLKGCCDAPASNAPRWRRILLRMAQRALRIFLGREEINAYNWNWASKQIRGITWYK